MKQINVEQALAGSASARRLPYTRPTLESVGAYHDVTLAGSCNPLLACAPVNQLTNPQSDF